MTISREEVRHVAALARLNLTQAELESLRGELDAILTYVGQLREINVEPVDPLCHPLELDTVFRNDLPVESLPVEQALANAPARQGNYFRVPAVFGQE